MDATGTTEKGTFLNKESMPSSHYDGKEKENEKPLTITPIVYEIESQAQKIAENGDKMKDNSEEEKQDDLDHRTNNPFDDEDGDKMKNRSEEENNPLDDSIDSTNGPIEEENPGDHNRRSNNPFDASSENTNDHIDGENQGYLSHRSNNPFDDSSSQSNSNNHVEEENVDGLENRINDPFDDINSESKPSLEVYTDAECNLDFSNNDQPQMKESLKKPLHVVETWDEITKRDKALSKANLIHVIDHSVAMLGERICEATNNKYFRESLKSFERTLGRFRNSEITLGKRIASGNFADIHLIHSFAQQQIDGTDNFDKPCTRDQAKIAEIVKQKNPDEYVVKVLRKNLLINPSLFATAAADFITEGVLLASLNHPHILAIRGRSVHGVEGFSTGKRDCVFFVLERVNGDLTHKMLEWKEQTSRHGFFSKGSRDLKMSMFRERVELLCDLASALAYLHERHVIHRDVSLSNVGIGSRGGKVKLLDFGLAKVLPPCRDENEKFLLTGTTGSLR